MARPLSRHSAALRRGALPLAVLLVLSAGCEPPAARLSDAGDDTVAEVVLGPSALAALPRDAQGVVTLPALAAATGATRVGLLADLDRIDREIPAIEARGVRADGTRGAWRSVETTWREARLFVALAELSDDAEVFAGAELRVGEPEALSQLTWSAIIPEPEVDAEVVSDPGSLQTTSSPLRAELGDLVQSRAVWDARSTNCTSADENKYRMAIHHTVTPSSGDPMVRLRGIQNYHMDTRGWCDIGYHFLVSADGRVWEGRPLELLGAHVGSNNTGNIGISYIGCFQTSGCEDWTPFEPPEEMIDGGASAVAALATIFDIAITSDLVKGHRDHTGATTSCPGDNLHARLDDIRSRALALQAETLVDPEPTETGTLGLELVSSSLPSGEYRIGAGAEVSDFLQVRNTGTATWTPETMFLITTGPREGASALAASDWPATGVVAAIDRDVAPGETGNILLQLRGPAEPGSYVQSFGFKLEGVGYFADQLGPSDDSISVTVVVDEGGVVLDGGIVVSDATVVGDGGVSAPSSSGCRAGGRPASSSALLLLALLVVARRRR